MLKKIALNNGLSGVSSCILLQTTPIFVKSQVFDEFRAENISLKTRLPRIALLIKLLLLLLLPLLDAPILLVDQLLLPLNVLEHEPTLLRKCHVVRVHARVLLVELEDAWQSIFGLMESIAPLQVLAEIIVDQIVFEY